MGHYCVDYSYTYIAQAQQRLVGGEGRRPLWRSLDKYFDSRLRSEFIDDDFRTIFKTNICHQTASHFWIGKNFAGRLKINSIIQLELGETPKNFIQTSGNQWRYKGYRPLHSRIYFHQTLGTQIQAYVKQEGFHILAACTYTDLKPAHLPYMFLQNKGKDQLDMSTKISNQTNK